VGFVRTSQIATLDVGMTLTSDDGKTIYFAKNSDTDSLRVWEFLSDKNKYGDLIEFYSWLIPGTENFYIGRYFSDDNYYYFGYQFIESVGNNQVIHFVPRLKDDPYTDWAAVQRDLIFAYLAEDGVLKRYIVDENSAR
jgi:hypothetical protein